MHPIRAEAELYQRDKILMKCLLTILVLVFSVTSKAEMQWVTGTVETLEDYGGHANEAFGVLIKIKDQTWHNSGDGEVTCTSRFRVVNGQLGMTEQVKNRIFSLMLSSYMAGMPVGLYVDGSNGPYCYVQIGRVGEGTF